MHFRRDVEPTQQRDSASNRVILPRGASAQICQVVHTQTGGDLSQPFPTGGEESAQQAVNRSQGRFTPLAMNRGRRRGIEHRGARRALQLPAADPQFPGEPTGPIPMSGLHSAATNPVVPSGSGSGRLPEADFVLLVRRGFLGGHAS